MTKSMISTVLAKKSGTNFVKAIETLHRRLVVVLQLFQIDIYNYFKQFLYIYIVYLSLDVRKKVQSIQKQNTTPHVLSREGYDYLEEKLWRNNKRNDWSKQHNWGALKQLLILLLPLGNM